MADLAADFEDMSAQAAQRHLAGLLRDGEIDSADLDARLLLQGALACDAAALARAPERILSSAEAAQLADYAAQRLAHKPVSRIFGRREFYGRHFIINDRVLDPRPDSETLIETALAKLPDAFSGQILDLGTGSGCLLLTLLAERTGAHGLGGDVSAPALDVARANAAQLGLHDRAVFIESDWLKNITGSFDMIIANPPYLGPGEMEWLARDVADYDPHLALYGGADGLDPYRHLSHAAVDFLAPAAWLIFEIGHLQARAVSHIMADAGFGAISVVPDLAGRDRVVIGQYEGAGQDG